MYRQLYFFLFAIIFGLSGFQTKAQLVVDNTSNTVPDLVNNVMLGFGASVTNITFTGDQQAIGYFNGINSNIGLDSGIVLTTGNALTAIGPNDIGSAGDDLGQAGDADLTAIAGNNTFDASILEFDFVPSNDTFSFYFVFASEEYPEFVNSINDVFAFFIDGANPSGGTYVNQNIALIPGTTTPVTINNVNDQVNTQYYVDNTGGVSVQYDGFTTILEATAAVDPDSTYHFKIAIADASDGVWDSGVFLQKNCSYEPQTTELVDGSEPIELSCGDTSLQITLNQPVLCSTLDSAGTDFRLRAPDGSSIPIAGAYSSNCSGNVGATVQITVDLYEPLSENGTYYLWSKTGNDFNTLLSACSGIPLAEFDTVTFVVNDCYDINPDLINVTVLENDSIRVQWRVPEDTVPTNPWQPLFETYDVFHSSSSLGPYNYIGSTQSLTDTFFVDTAADVQSTNNYKIQVKLNTGFESMDSDSIQAILLSEDPFAPVDTTKLFLTWTDYWGWANPTYYVMERYENDDWVEVGSSNTTDFEYTRNTGQGGFYHVKVESRFPDLAPELVSESNWITYENTLYETIIPNVITPDGDDKNDKFFIRNLHLYPGSALKIYNRWGKKIYESEDYQNDWDGDNKKAGTYYYVLEAPGAPNKTKSGYFVIIR